MANHVDDMRAEDQPYIRTTDNWAYGERAYWRTEEKFVETLEAIRRYRGGVEN